MTVTYISNERKVYTGSSRPHKLKIQHGHQCICVRCQREGTVLTMHFYVQDSTAHGPRGPCIVDCHPPCYGFQAVLYLVSC